MQSLNYGAFVLQKAMRYHLKIEDRHLDISLWSTVNSRHQEARIMCSSTSESHSKPPIRLH